MATITFDTLPCDILFEIFHHLLFLTPNPIDEESPHFPRGYTIKLPTARDYSEYRPLWTLQNVTYRHPLVALLLVSRSTYHAVEAFAAHINRSPLFGTPHVSKSELARKEPLSQTFLCVRSQWTQCAFCGKKTRSLGVFALFLRVCCECEHREFEKIKLQDVQRLYALSDEELQLGNDVWDPCVKPRRGYVKSGKSFKVVFLKSDIEELVKKKNEEGRGKVVEVVEEGEGEEVDGGEVNDEGVDKEEVEGWRALPLECSQETVSVVDDD